ncbi:hypothetical protein P8452_34328 [Trifolium repens]|nr:hypothetical protein P8452_34328 [Trifolium repens]
MECINESCDAENECRVLQTCNSAYSDGDSEPPKKKLRGFNIWDYFVRIDKDGKEMCECTTCGKVFTCGGKSGHDTETVKDKMSSVRKAIHALFDEYADKSASTSSSLSVQDLHSSTSTEESNVDKSFREYLVYLEKQRQEKYIDGLTQLDHYLKDTDGCYSFKNPLEYWKYRSCMPSENLQALVCSHNWLFGFAPSDQFGDAIEETKKVGINLFKQDSKCHCLHNENKNED